MTKLDEAIEEAVELASRSNGPFRHGCVVMNGKKIVARGNNHVRKKIGTLSIHAEMDALWKMDADYSSLKAIIVRSSKTGMLGNSRPCDMCMNALRQHGVKTILYSTNNGFAMENITS
jgi:tRNA(Arg) A34 adenosine deaminase TadA